MIDPTKAAEKTIGALSGTPMLLVLVLLYLGGLVTATYLISASAELRFRERAELIKALRDCTQIRSQ